MKKKNWTPFWIISVVGLIVFIYGLANNPPARYSGKPSGTVTVQEIVTTTVQPSAGDFVITSTNEWKGPPSCYDGSKRIVCRMTTKDVWRQVRINRDDSTILTLPPSNWTTTHTELPEFTSIEYRLDPERPAPEGRIEWVITNRK